ncbi:hypothetical protein ESCO_005052 [Escovopsis weberi]|uniref:Uncharacterized protein n=1 Tax=Escovopsis weberi TaxID=150374 RepID=A0A0M8N639_ESCWE|nr:hypothetical protein ESCO_005052 [Escovopsis weberi]
MAFQQSAQQAAQRIARPPSLCGGDAAAAGVRSPHPQQQQHHHHHQELSPTWVLFSPPTEVTATSYLTETERSIQTPGRSRLSDLGSLNTGAEAAPSSAVLLTDEGHPAAPEDDSSSLADDAEELDSLDGHLPGFRSLPPSRTNQHIFPSHDGLGSFRLDQPALGPEAQDQIYEFEAFNPRRMRHRPNSFEQAQLEIEETRLHEAEKRQRIEDWRLEHSRILLEEIQRETRCRQRLRASMRRSQQQHQQQHQHATRQAEADTDTDTDNMDWHEQEGATSEEEEDADAGHSLLARLTRAALRELLGIDERLLSILLGESVIGEDNDNDHDHDHDHEPPASRTPRTPPPDEGAAAGDSWQMQILERVSRELGLLVDQLSRYPGAFSTYARAHQQASGPFASLPVIPETTTTTTAAAAVDGRTATGTATPTQTTVSMTHEADFFPDFRPTVLPSGPRGRAVLSRKSSESGGGGGGTSLRDAVAMSGGTFTQEEWERDMDIKLVFRYLPSSSSAPFSSPADHARHHHNIPKPQYDAAAKAARMRHHPLISRVTRPAERRASFKAAATAAAAAAAAIAWEEQAQEQAQGQGQRW